AAIKLAGLLRHHLVDHLIWVGILIIDYRAPPETCCGNGAQRKFPLARR
ncbi:MAG: hypothetical protein ACI957_004876, partial [Verrucomicrobiales bacterium]